MKLTPRIVIRYNHLARVRKKAKEAVEWVITETGKDLHEKLLFDLIEAPKSGAVYGDHQASAPGEPPAWDTGELGESIEISGTPQRLRLSVGAPHLVFLEVGTVHMAPRPWVAPNIEWARKRFSEMIDTLPDRIKP